MIIRVRIRNFLSFNKEIEFSMIPGQGRLKKEHKTTPIGGYCVLKLQLYMERMQVVKVIW